MRIRNILIGLVISLSLYGAYFFDLVRKEYRVLLERQEALESLKLLGVPGSAFLHDLGTLFLFKSSLFFLILLGLLLTVALLFSLCFRSPWQRALFFLVLVVGISWITHDDRIRFSFPFVTALSCGAFFFTTLGIRIQATWKDLMVLVILGVVVSSALYAGAQYHFFIKTRDRVLFDSSLGARVVSYYYTYTPLAAAVISPARGVYEGLVYWDEFKMPFHHLGKGLVLSGEPLVKPGADFIVTTDNGRVVMANRYGERAEIPSPGPESIRAAADSLFTMHGFKNLTRVALYAFPAGLLMAPFFLLRLATRSRKAFGIQGGVVGLGLLIFIGVMSLTGVSRDRPTPAEALHSKNASLGLAYEFDDRRTVPAEYVPAVLAWGRSESIALRYWGAKLLGYVPADPEYRSRLDELLNDPSPNVRYAAALSLVHMLRVASFNTLLPHLLNDPNWYVRCIIFSAFLRSGTIPHHD